MNPPNSSDPDPDDIESEIKALTAKIDAEHAARAVREQELLKLIRESKVQEQKELKLLNDKSTLLQKAKKKRDETGTCSGFDYLRSLSISWSDIKFLETVTSGQFDHTYAGTYIGGSVCLQAIPHQRHIKVNSATGMVSLGKKIRSLIAAGHPNVIQIFGFTVAPDTTPYLVMELATESLDKLLIRPCQLTWPARIKMLRDIARGMFFIHYRLFMVHRGIKPSNLLLMNDGTVKVGDLLSGRTVEHDSAVTLAGSACWAAPEILMEEKCSFPADVFSFGIVVWQLIAWERKVPQRLLRDNYSLDGIRCKFDGKRAGVSSSLLGVCPDKLWALFLDCTKFKPEHRPASNSISGMLDVMLKDAS